MSFLKRVKETITPKSITVQLAETRLKLSSLEDRFTILVRKERNAYNNAKYKHEKAQAQDRLRNAYVSLRLVHLAQQRLYDVSSTQDLNTAIRDLNASLGMLNRMDKKTDRGAAARFLNRRSAKMINRDNRGGAGGVNQFYEDEIAEHMMPQDIMDKLVETTLPLAAIIDADNETIDSAYELAEDIEFTHASGGGEDIDIDETLNALMADLY